MFRLKEQLTNGFILKVLIGLIGIFSVYVQLNFLGVESYGLWVTIFSMSAWFSLIDGGIGSGLRNKLGEQVKIGNNHEAVSYVFSAAVILFLSLCLLYFLLFNLIYATDVSFLFPQNGKIINLEEILALTLLSFLLLILSKFWLNIPAAFHYSEWSSASYLLQQVVFIVLIFLFNLEWQGENSSLYNLVKLHLFSIVISYLPISFYAAIKFLGLKELIKSKFSFNKFRSIFNLGWKFFIIQTCAILLYSTDLYIINYFFGGNDSAEYSVNQKYFGIMMLLASVFAAPLWSMVVSIKKNGNKGKFLEYKPMIIKFFLIIVFGLLGLIVGRDLVFSYWLSHEIFYNNYDISILIMILTLFNSLMLIIGYIVNGFGHLRLQMYTAIFASVANVLLSIGGIILFDYGVNWVILVSILVSIPGMYFGMLQIFRLVHGNAFGVFVK